MLCLILLIFLVQFINWWSEMPTSITLFWDIFSEDLVRMWSSSVEVEHFIRAGCFSQWKCLAKFFVFVYEGRTGIFKFIWLIFFEYKFSILKWVEIEVSEKINFIVFLFFFFIKHLHSNIKPTVARHIWILICLGKKPFLTKKVKKEQ